MRSTVNSERECSASLVAAAARNWTSARCFWKIANPTTASTTMTIAAIDCSRRRSDLAMRCVRSSVVESTMPATSCTHGDPWASLARRRLVVHAWLRFGGKGCAAQHVFERVGERPVRGVHVRIVVGPPGDQHGNDVFGIAELGEPADLLVDVVRLTRRR